MDIYTAYYDKDRCFPETLKGDFSITQSGNWFPRPIGSLGHAFCAYMRCILAALALAWFAFRSACCPAVTTIASAANGIQTFVCRQGKQYDVVFVDQVSVIIPVLRALTSSKV